MEKVFLSHSSADKAYVEHIANQLGKDRCVYDMMCFDAGMKAIDEIFRELNNTSIFVLFISNTALDSPWVQKELARAEEALHHDQHKLSQIFPIIVDPEVTYTDQRIPSFLRKGMGSYILRYIPNPLIAYRKITTQLRKYLFEENADLRNKYDIFYGRNTEVAKFMEQLDAGSGINCFVASGINGIGRVSYIKQCLKRAQVIPEYYEPAIISMKKFDGIEDLLVRLSEAGFGNISINDLQKYPTMEQKTSMLLEILQNIQNLREYVIVYDDGCLVNNSGELAYWFDNVLRELRKEVTVSIAASYRMREVYLKRHTYLFAQDLSTLPYEEWMGLMRVYGQSVGICLSTDERRSFRDVLYGYPPQVLYCVDLIKENSLEYVQRNTHELIQKFANKATAVLRAAIPPEFADAGYGFLSFLSSYGVVPTLLVMELVELNPLYRNLFSTFKSLTICRYLGAVGEYIEVNPLIADYVQRNRFSFPSDIQELLGRKLASFNSELNSGSAVLDEDFESVRFYLKENLKNGDQVPERFMYSSLYLSAIHELYNRQQYSQVINIVRKLKEVGALDLYDEPAKDQLIDYYCRSLAREGNQDFYTEVEHFRTRKSYLYHFLRGFMYRHTGAYDKALQQYNEVLRERPNHKSARREIVVVYRGLGDYSTSFDFAQANYRDESDNPYMIQPYFEILVKSPTRLNMQTQKDIAAMRDTLLSINESKPNSCYYELEAMYAAYIEKDLTRAKAYLNAGRRQFQDSSYIERAYFDCCEFHHDIPGMVESLANLKRLISGTTSISVAYHMREPLLAAHQHKSRSYVINMVNQITGINDESKQRLISKVDLILKG